MSNPPRTPGHNIRGANATAYQAQLAQDPEYLAELAGDAAQPDPEPDARWIQEAEADAWGGRGPSASYAEWVAEGREPEAQL